MNSCPYGLQQLWAINGQNNITFTTPTSAGVSNPVLFPFSGNYQPNGYRLKVTVSDQHTNYSQLIDTLAIDFVIPTPYELSSPSSALTYTGFNVQGDRNAAPKTT